MNKPLIGFIGFGKMGTPMSQQLIRSGYAVTVYNRHKEKEAALTAAGAQVKSSPAELIASTDIVVLMIADDAAVKDVFEGEQGLFAANVSSKTVINMSTVSPLISKEMEVRCKLQGNHYLDAPVSGSVKQATDGTLVIMAGGDETVFANVKPVLESMGKMALLVGPTGAGNVAKLAINTLLGFYALGLAEAVVLAESNGIKTEDLLNLLNNGALANVFTKIKGDAILQDNYNAAFALKHIVKDVGLAKDIGLDTPMGEVMYDVFRKAEKEFGEEDVIAVVKSIRKAISISQ